MWRSLQRAGECKHLSDMKKRHNLGGFIMQVESRFWKSLPKDNLLYKVDKKDLLLHCSGILQKLQIYVSFSNLSIFFFFFFKGDSSPDIKSVKKKKKSDLTVRVINIHKSIYL